MARTTEESRKYYALYRKENRDKLLAYKRNWWKGNSATKLRQKEWYYKNLERNRLLRNENNKKRRLQIIELLGGKCLHCGYNKDSRALQIDHVNGGGNKERNSLGHSASALMKKIKLNIEKYQLLCANCNWIKRYEKGELLWGNRT